MGNNNVIITILVKNEIGVLLAKTFVCMFGYMVAMARLAFASISRKAGNVKMGSRPWVVFH